MIAPLHTFIDSIPVLLAVQEEFTGTDHTVWAAQFMQMIVDRDDLFRRVHMYILDDVKKPNVFRNMFPYSEIPKIPFNDRTVPHNMPKDIWITDTTFRDGQQSRAPYTIRSAHAAPRHGYVSHR